MSFADDKPYTCSECRKCFRSEQNLHEHLRTHTGERPYKCRLCDKAFKTSGTRCRHERSHEGSHEFMRKPTKPSVYKKTYACTRCSEQFPSTAARSNHMKKSHKLASQYFCLQCDVELTSVEDLMLHHSSEHSSVKGKTSVQQASHDCLLKDEDQGLAYHLLLNELNVKDTVMESCGKTLSNVLRNSPELQKEGLDKLMYAQLAGKRTKTASDSHFLCKHCEKMFFKLPLFLKHLLKHSNGGQANHNKTNTESEPSIMKNEAFDDEPNITAENELIDDGQTVMMSCRSSPVMVEVKNVSEFDDVYLAEIENTHETKRDLQRIIDEFTLHETDSELHGIEQNSLNEKVNSSVGRMSRKQRQRAEQKKQSNRKSKVNKRQRSEGLCADVDCSVPDVLLNCTEVNSEEISCSDGSGCILDGNKNQIFCEKCGGKLNRIYQHHDFNKETYACDACGQLFCSLQQAKDGSNNDEPESLSCDVQGSNIVDHSDQKPNQKANSTKKHYGCTLCEVKFKTKKLCELHGKTHVLSNSFKHRDKSSPKPSKDLEHKPSTAREPFSCTACGRRFAVKYRLQRHMIIHTGEKPFVCNECGKGFTTNAYLKSHMARHTNELTHLCSTCGKRFADRIAWRYHRRVHDLARRTNNHTVKEHICWICGYQFNRASNLARHILKHQNSEELLHKCNECNRQFRTKEGFRYHVGQHAQDKPYLCMDCPKAFADAFCLKTHLKSHAQQGSFECGVCGKKYRTMFILKMHAKHHTELRYSCEVCGETFGFARQFRSHIIKHRPPFECEVCGVTTTRAADLRKHKRRFQH